MIKYNKSKAISDWRNKVTMKTSLKAWERLKHENYEHWGDYEIVCNEKGIKTGNRLWNQNIFPDHFLFQFA